MDLLFSLTLIALASYSHQFPPNDDGNVQALVDRLNTLLKNAGWGSLNHVQVKYVDGTLGRSTFSGKDLFIASEEPDEFHVTGENVLRKYCRTAELLGCVYGTALIRLIHLAKPILDECYSELGLAKERERGQKRRYDKMFKSGMIAVPFAVRFGNYMTTYNLFNGVLEQFANSRKMFDYMLFAMNYLVEPLKTITDHRAIVFMQIIMDSVIVIRDIKTVYPREYHKNTDENVHDFFAKLKNILENQVNGVLLPLLNKFCIHPNEYNYIVFNKIPLTEGKTKTKITVEGFSQPVYVYEYSELAVRVPMENHVQEVVDKFFLELGFLCVDGPV